MRRYLPCLGLLTAVLALTFVRAQNKPPEPPPGTKVLRDVEYVKDGHERQKLDLYIPEDPVGPLPLVVWIHGGGWQAGSKERTPALPLVTKGYVVASINYRLSQHAVFPAQVEDCKAAIRWLRANAKTHKIDPERIAVWGGSAGGHLVALLGTTAHVKELEGKSGNLDQSSRVQAVIDWYGPTDFLHMGDKVNDPKSPVFKLLGGTVTDKKELTALASPVTHVTKEAAPLLIMHGDQDPAVPFSQSEILAEALKKAGVEVTLKKLEGAKHGGPEFTNSESRKLIEDFLEKHLKKSK
jgi:acetyl esterase/lipase